MSSPSSHLRKSELPVAIFYEHPQWFSGLFRKLEENNIPYVLLKAPEHFYDPGEREVPYSLVINRMSPSAYTRGHASSILYTQQYLEYLESIGANVLNGREAFLVETSKARQLEIFERLKVQYPRTIVVHDVQHLPGAAAKIGFPLIIKPNIGGSGAHIQKFESPDELQTALKSRSIDLGIDQTGLLQQYIPPQNNEIIRIEIIDGEFLYAIKLVVLDSFNACPADGCQITSQKEKNLKDGVSGRPALITAYTPPSNLIEIAKELLATAQADIGGVEYLIGPDGIAYFYDINPISNFVRNAPAVVGFEPLDKLTQYIQKRRRSSG